MRDRKVLKQQHTDVLEAENSRLRKALADTKLDVGILRKSTAYFAKGSR